MLSFENKTAELKDDDWMCLVECPPKDTSNIISLNESEFIVAANTGSTSSQLFMLDGIWKYNIYDKKWIMLICYPAHLIYHNALLLFRKDMNELYLYGEGYELFGIPNIKMSIIDMNTYNFTTIETQFFDRNTTIIFAENKCHLIKSDHYIYNDDKKQFELSHQFNVQSGVYFVGSVYVKWKKELIVFGGRSINDDTSIDSIYIYSFKDNIWIKSTTTLPIKMHYFGYIMTPNEKFVIIFGGYNSMKQKYLDNIYIWNIDTMEITQSKIACPVMSGFHAGITYDQTQDILVYGYCRKQQKLPHDLVKIIHKWYCDNYVHLVDRRSGKHWKIEINKLFV